VLEGGSRLNGVGVEGWLVGRRKRLRVVGVIAWLRLIVDRLCLLFISQWRV